MTQLRFRRKTSARARHAPWLCGGALVWLLAAAVPASGTAAGVSGGDWLASATAPGKQLGDAVGSALGDSLLTGRVKTAVMKEAGAAGNPVTVEAREGKVMLSGTVRDRETAALVERSAAGVDGVRSVENHLRIGKR